MVWFGRDLKDHSSSKDLEFMLTAYTQFPLMFGAIQNSLAFFTLGTYKIRVMTGETGKTGVRLTVMMPLMGI